MTGGKSLLSRTYPAEVKEALGRYPPGREASAVLSLLYLAQAAYGHLTDEAVGRHSRPAPAAILLIVIPVGIHPGG